MARRLCGGALSILGAEVMALRLFQLAPRTMRADSVAGTSWRGTIKSTNNNIGEGVKNTKKSKDMKNKKSKKSSFEGVLAH